MLLFSIMIFYETTSSIWVMAGEVGTQLEKGSKEGTRLDESDAFFHSTTRHRLAHLVDTRWTPVDGVVTN